MTSSLISTIMIHKEGNNNMESKEKPTWWKNKVKYEKDYQRMHTTNIGVKLYDTRDKDLIEVYKKIPNKTEWIRAKIREYGEEHGLL